MTFEHRTPLFVSSLFGVGTFSLPKQKKKQEILSAFVRELPRNGTMLECFSGDGKNFLKSFLRYSKKTI